VSTTGGIVSVFIAEGNGVPPSDTAGWHDIDDKEVVAEPGGTHPDYTVKFDSSSIQPKATAVYQQLPLDAQVNVTHGYVLSGSCSFEESACPELETVAGRLHAVHEGLVRAGVDSRRIVDVAHADGTASVKIFVVSDINNDVWFPGGKSIAEEQPSSFLGGLLNNMQSTLPDDQYRLLKASFDSCTNVAVIFYPARLDLSWAQGKGTERNRPCTGWESSRPTI
jgi:hypothetical protein